MDAGLAARDPEIFDIASRVLGIDAAALVATGSAGEADLGSTKWAQPAIVACGIASFRALGEPVAAAAGHSIGEYAALASAGVLCPADALHLVGVRATAMDEAAQTNPGGMVAVMRLERDVIDEICAQTGVFLGADNSAGQVTLSGDHDRLEAAYAAAEAAGGKCRTLDVAGAFHSPAMAPATEALSAALSEVELHDPAFEVWSTTTAAPVSTPGEIRASLVDQLVSPVLFRQTVSRLSRAHGPVFVDVGPGKVVGGLARRIAEGAEVRYATDLLSVGGSS